MTSAITFSFKCTYCKPKLPAKFSILKPLIALVVKFLCITLDNTYFLAEKLKNIFVVLKGDDIYNDLCFFRLDLLSRKCMRVALAKILNFSYTRPISKVA